MIARWRAAGLIAPTIFTLALLPILIGLGTWQWQRKAWKENLISQVQSRSTAEPVSYDEALSRASIPNQSEYLRVRVSGAFDHASERHVYAPARQGSGWHVYTLFKPDNGKPYVFINRGWVPDAVKDASKRPDGQIPGPVTVTGLVRASEQKGWFTPDNDVTGNRWYSRDLAGMRASLANAPDTVPDTEPKFAPFAIDAEAEPANPGGWPKGGTTEIRLTNSHLQYVVTWYGLALTLIGVFVVFARQRLTALRDGTSQA